MQIKEGEYARNKEREIIFNMRIENRIDNGIDNGILHMH